MTVGVVAAAVAAGCGGGALRTTLAGFCEHNGVNAVLAVRNRGSTRVVLDGPDSFYGLRVYSSQGTLLLAEQPGWSDPLGGFGPGGPGTTTIPPGRTFTMGLYVWFERIGYLNSMSGFGTVPPSFLGKFVPAPPGRYGLQVFLEGRDAAGAPLTPAATTPVYSVRLPLPACPGGAPGG